MKFRLQEIKLAIHQTIDCEFVRLLETSLVDFSSDHEIIDKKVYRCEIEGHSIASQCFAWGEVRGPMLIAVPVVLKLDGISNAIEAVNCFRGAQ